MSLFPITKPRVIRRIIAYDLEWIPGDLTVRMVGTYDGERYNCYRSVADFLDSELTSRNRGKWFYAHAGGLADFQFILYDLYSQLKSRGYRIEGHFSGSSLIIAKVTRGHNSWYFLDSYWLLKAKLKDVAKWIGQSKGGGGYEEDFPDPDEEGISDDEFERRCILRREWYATVPFEKLRQYNARDCRILYDAISSFEATLLEIGGQLQMTLASCSMQLFRRKYLKHDIPTSKTINKIAKEAYTASRVENHDREMNSGYYFDINSSFPFAMTFPAPGRYIGARAALPDSGIYIAKVRVSVPDMPIPPLPYRHSNRVFFPVGEWEAWMTNIDIEALQEAGGRVMKSREALLFEPFEDLSDFSNDIYNLRKKASSEWEKVVFKFLLNSLYGKFAEASEKDELLVNPDFIDRNLMHMLQPGIWIAEKIVSIPHAHFPISAHVTAIARQLIGKFINLCDKVFYLDTDGFATNTMFDTNKELGGLKLEKKVHEGEFVAPKVYSLKGDILQPDGTWKYDAYYKAKGFSRMTATRFARLLEGETIEYERMTRIRENIVKNPSLQPREQRVYKRMKMRGLFAQGFNPSKHPIPKRFTYPDGKTRPWSVNEIDDLLSKEKE